MVAFVLLGSGMPLRPFTMIALGGTVTQGPSRGSPSARGAGKVLLGAQEQCAKCVWGPGFFVGARSDASLWGPGSSWGTQQRKCVAIGL